MSAHVDLSADYVEARCEVCRASFAVRISVKAPHRCWRHGGWLVPTAQVEIVWKR